MCSSECAGQNSFSMGFASSLARCKIEEGSDESQLVKRKRKGAMQGYEDWCTRSSFTKSSSAKSGQGSEFGNHGKEEHSLISA